MDTVKEANKGESVVIKSTNYYCKMVYDHLNDNQIYKKTWQHLWQQGNKTIKKLTQKNQNILQPNSK